MSRPVNLYRHFAADGTLLYVGVSLSAITRLAQHNKNADWAESIARIDIETFPSREIAVQAEISAIKSENPLWNKTHRRAVPGVPSAPSGKKATMISRQDCLKSSMTAIIQSELTDKEISEKIDECVPTVWRWRTGKTLPNPKVLGKLSKVLGCAPADLRPDWAAIFGADT